MRNFRWLLPLLAVVLIPMSASAQSGGTIRGTVQDAATSRPIASAQIQVVGTSLGTVADAQGNFQVSVPAGTHTLRASAPGFAAMETSVTVAAGQTATTTLRLMTSAISLDELVVTGVSGATARAKVPFAIAKVDAAEIQVATSSAANALTGKVAGAQVVSGSGRPGAAPSILLRGPTSIVASGRSQEPLYIVDGVILSGSMTDIDALDIESIEIVKGAAGASLYGSRAANGVIQITTKRGARSGDNTVRYTLRSEYGQSEMASTPEALLGKKHRFLLQNGKFVDQQGNGCDWLECASVKLAGQTAGSASANAWNTYQNQAWPGQTVDQVKSFFNDGNFIQNYIAAEGRAGETNFHVSYSNLTDQGVLPGMEGLKRNNFRVNLDQAIRENVQVQASAFYSKSTSDQFPESQGNPLFDLTRMPAGVDLYACADDPTKSCRKNTGNLILLADPTNRESPNPLYEVYTRKYTQDRGRFLGSANLRYTPLTWMDVEGNVSYDRLNLFERDYLPKGYRTIEPSQSTNNGSLYQYNAADESFNASATATFRPNLGDNIRNRTQFRYLLERSDADWEWANGWNFAAAGVPSLNNLDQTTVTTASGGSPIRADGYYAITNFDILDRYIIDALVRNDGSSLFGVDQRRQWYYRLAGAWRVTQEPWFTMPGVDELKLRYSYGTAGGRPRFSAQYETFSVSGGRITPVSLGNKDLKPEFSTEQEAGVDAAIFGGRLTAGVTYARTVTENQILPVPLSAHTGYATQWQNAGTLSSNTWELSLDARLIERGSFSWTGRVLWDRTRSEITKLNIPAFRYGVAGQNLGNVFYAREGEKLGTFYGTNPARACGDLPSGMNCGDFVRNGDGYLVWTGGGSLAENKWGTNSGLSVNGKPVMWGAPIAAKCVNRSTGENTYFCETGNSLPDYHLSFSSNMSWRGFSVYGLLDAVQGFSVYNQPLQWAVFAGTAGIYDQSGPIEQQKPIGYYAAQYDNLGGLGPSGIFVEDGSFVKLRELTLRYRVGGPQLARVPGFNQLGGMTFSVVGRNLHTWTKYRGFDPEVGKSGGDTGSAALARVEGYQYPNFRTFTFGVELNF